MNETTLYPFDADTYATPIWVTAKSGARVTVYHRLRKPTLAELIERESQINYEMIELNSREDEIKSDSEIANARLWDKIALAVKGYHGSDEWHDLTEQDRSDMKPGDKSAAIATMYAGNCEIEGDDDNVYIGSQIWTVRQDIGLTKDEPDYIVRHTLREPTEAERVKFKRSNSSTSYVKGAKKSQVRVRTNLKAFVELYDALMTNIEGATVGTSELFGAHGNRAQFLSAIDPIWKRQVIQTLMSALEAQLSD